MPASSSQLESQRDDVDTKIANLLSDAAASDSSDKKTARKKALKELQAVRRQLSQYITEAAAAELRDVASPVSDAAARAERDRVERVLAELATVAQAAVATFQRMTREVEAAPADAGAPVADPAPPVMTEVTTADPAILRRTPRGHLVFGHLVGRLQGALTAEGYDTKGIDLYFGNDTETALTDWHGDTGATEPQAVSAAEWTLLTGAPVPDLFDFCAQVTAAFEGHGFTKAVGDFDGAVATWGYHGYTLKYGHLQNVLKASEAALPGLLDDAFGAGPGADLRAMLGMSRSAQIAWGKATLLNPDGRMRADWAGGFQRLGGIPACQSAQLDYSRRAFWERLALPQAARLGLSEGLSLAMMFDTAIQQGGFGESAMQRLLAVRAAEPEMSEQALRGHIAREAASRAKGAFRKDVAARRGCLVDGRGAVHGKSFDLSYWGLLAAFDEGEGQLAAETPAAGSAQAASAPLAPSAQSTDFESFFAQHVKPVAANFSAAEFLTLGRQNSVGKCAGKNTEPPRALWENCIPLARVLQALREDAGASVVITGMYRSPAYNACVGGVTRSQHLQFRAADIQVRDGKKPRDWAERLRRLRSAGVFRGGIGTYGTFVHVDVRGQDADWTG